MKPSANSSPLDWHHAIRSIPTSGLAVERDATPAEREQLAEALDVLSIERLKVSYKLKPISGARYAFNGTMSASLTQACVVSLEPVQQTLNEGFAIVFAPPGAKESLENQQESKAAPVLELPDIEPITGDALDVGRVLYELLSASIDPYPRKDAAEFNWDGDRDTSSDDAHNKPFAALAKLKPKT